MVVPDLGVEIGECAGGRAGEGVPADDAGGPSPRRDARSLCRGEQGHHLQQALQVCQRRPAAPCDAKRRLCLCQFLKCHAEIVDINSCRVVVVLI